MSFCFFPERLPESILFLTDFLRLPLHSEFPATSCLSSPPAFQPASLSAVTPVNEETVYFPSPLQMGMNC